MIADPGGRDRSRPPIAVSFLGDPRPTEEDHSEGAMNGAVRVGALALVAFVVGSPDSALARLYLRCLTKKVVIVESPGGSSSSSVEENLAFWVDEAGKAIVLADGTPLTVRRFDRSWISAARDDMSYEFDRQNGTLTYAGSIRMNSAETITIGSGRCEIAAVPG